MYDWPAHKKDTRRGAGGERSSTVRNPLTTEVCMHALTQSLGAAAARRCNCWGHARRLPA